MSIENDKISIDDTPEDLINNFLDELKSNQKSDKHVLLPNETFLDKNNTTKKYSIRTSTIVKKINLNCNS